MKRTFVLQPGEKGVRAASSLLRFLAGIVDLVIPIGLTLLVCVTAGYPDVTELPVRYWNYLDYFVDVFNQKPSFMLFPATVFVAMYVVSGTVFTACVGNTPVSRLFSITARNMAGEPVGWFRAFVWTLTGLVFALVAFAGPLWTVVDPKRRMLHDILARVVVVSGRSVGHGDDGVHGALIPPLEDASPAEALVPDAGDVPWRGEGRNW
ncbi:MAG TPA: RDD family protein [Myxococcota bacterium]|nr:RDD family protein [Myxococcota bacterium]HNZ03363.1 RDD family protein [Myxococcota bacterium]HOD06657.1 RDD family protein [Myxococcota bacterium]HPB50485.1 RDD family protein [Myxococcota bacterium]HQP95389.1 RDD family protein [Myxococcota bacterium]